MGKQLSLGGRSRELRAYVAPHPRWQSVAPLSRAPKLPFNLGASTALPERSDSLRTTRTCSWTLGLSRSTSPRPTPSRSYLPGSVSGPSRTAAPAATHSASRSGPSCSCRPARAPLPRGSFPGPSLAAFAFAFAASPSSQAPGSASPCPPWAQRQPRCAGKPPGCSERSGSRTPLRIPALVRPFRDPPLRAPSAPCSEVARSQRSALSGARSGRAAKSVRVGCALFSAPCRSPRLGALALPAAGHNAQRRRALALESAGRGGASRAMGRGVEDGGGAHGALQGGSPPLGRSGRAGAYQRGPSKNVEFRAQKNQSAEKPSPPNLLSKNKENKLSCPS